MSGPEKIGAGLRKEKAGKARPASVLGAVKTLQFPLVLIYLRPKSRRFLMADLKQELRSPDLHSDEGGGLWAFYVPALFFFFFLNLD